LAAVLLRHGGHQARGERLALGERHALLGRKGRIVPGSLVVAGERRTGGRSGPERRRLAAAQRRDADRVGRERRREEARQPDALLGGERRVLRDHEGRGGCRLDAHASASSAMRLSASMS
jgi:hypothetical protein